MAVVNVKSSQITNRDATPRVLSNASISKAEEKIAVGLVTSTSGDSIDSVYRFFSVPSNARVHMLNLYCGDLGTTTIADFGLHDTTANGGAVVDRDFFASAVSLSGGALNGTDITHEADGAFGIDDGEKMIWQALGLTEDSKKDYDVTAMLTAANDGTGFILLKGAYAI